MQFVRRPSSLPVFPRKAQQIVIMPSTYVVSPSHNPSFHYYLHGPGLLSRGSHGPRWLDEESQHGSHDCMSSEKTILLPIRTPYECHMPPEYAQCPRNICSRSPPWMAHNPARTIPGVQRHGYRHTNPSIEPGDHLQIPALMTTKSQVSISLCNLNLVCWRNDEYG